MEKYKYYSSNSGEYCDEQISNIISLNNTCDNLYNDLDLLKEQSIEIIDFYNNIIIFSLNLLYPIGSIYYSFNGEIPFQEQNFGKWEQIKDTFLLSTGDFYTINSFGGSSVENLQIANLPTHQHLTPFYGNAIADGTYTASHYNFIYGQGPTINSSVSKTEMFNMEANASDGDEVAYLTQPIGNNKGHNNMPPYITIYMWKRIS